ncbi:MAG: hypothetical protein HGA51_09215, partial [Demequinaceae bacterium]|nr:hypothetical protein [Demequinaceae bacterium]
MKRIARASALALLAALALSGCIRYNVDMTLSEDDTASGTIVIAVQKGVGEQMGVATDKEALTQLFGDSPFGPDFTPKEYADGDWVGQSYTFDAVPITDLADLASLFTVTRDEDVFAVDGAAAPVTDDQKSQLPPGAESKLSITFPGEVIDSNGTVDGRTVTWDLFTMTDPIHATGNATGPGSGSGSGVPTWMLIGGAVALVVLVGAVVAVILVRRRGATEPINPAPLDGALETPAPVPGAAAEPLVVEQLAPPAAPVVEQPAPPAAPVAEQPAPPADAPKKRAPRVA